LVNDLYKLLKNKEIIAILDSDVSFGEYEFNDLSKTDMSLPYLSGAKNCELYLQFRYPPRRNILLCNWTKEWDAFW